MAEYIEREAIRDALYDADAITMEGVKILNQFTPSDVEPVRHAHWELTGADKYGRGGIWKCTGRDGCGKFYPYKCDFCPNCGAKMDEEVSE